MCRIMCLHGTNKQKAKKYLDAFFRAGANDPYLEKIVQEFDIPKLKNQHIHGWGYILLTKDSLHHYTHGGIFLHDTQWQKSLQQHISELQGEFVLMIELRVTDEGHVSAFNAHPFYFLSRNGYEGYLFYNGLLDYPHLAELEGIDYEKYLTKNGTTLMGISIAKSLEAWKKMSEALLEPRKAVKSSYNLMLLYRDEFGKYKYNILAYISEKFLSNDIVYTHNKLITQQEDDMFFAGSSAIELYLPWNYSIMENGQQIEREITFIDEYYFDGYEK